MRTDERGLPNASIFFLLADGGPEARAKARETGNTGGNGARRGDVRPPTPSHDGEKKEVEENVLYP